MNKDNLTNGEHIPATNTDNTGYSAKMLYEAVENAKKYGYDTIMIGNMVIHLSDIQHNLQECEQEDVCRCPHCACFCQKCAITRNNDEEETETKGSSGENDVKLRANGDEIKGEKKARR